jgi:hypothetical protein
MRLIAMLAAVNALAAIVRLRMKGEAVGVGSPGTLTSLGMVISLMLRILQTVEAGHNSRPRFNKL